MFKNIMVMGKASESNQASNNHSFDELPRVQIHNFEGAPRVQILNLNHQEFAD